MTGSLVGRTAVITGASRGFGEATARRFAAEGCDLILTHRSGSEACDAIAEDHRKAGGRAIVVQVDVTRSDDVKRLADTVADEFGQLDILVNNAGILKTGPFAQSSPEDWAAEIATNVVGALSVTHAMIPLIRPGGTGRIITLSSQVAPYGWEIGAVYAGTKAFLVSWSKSLARELGPQGTTVNAIGPGSIATDMNASLYGDEAEREQRRLRVPLRRIGKPDDVASTAAFLASDDASFMTGQLLICNGGAMI